MANEKFTSDNNIKKCLNNPRILQDKVSKTLGLTFHTIFKIKACFTTNPNIDIVKKIAKCLTI